MTYLPQKPANCAFECWGLKYQDGDRECMQCHFKDTCRPAMMAKLIPASSLTSPPILSQVPIPLPPRPLLAPVSLPSPPAYQPQPTYQQTQVYRPPYPALPAPQPPVHVQQAQVTQVQPYQNTILDHNNPYPWLPMFRPGAAAPQYYMGQHPGETVGIRLLKNLILRSLEVISQELTLFFRHFMWPPKSGKKN